MLSFGKNLDVLRFPRRIGSYFLPSFTVTVLSPRILVWFNRNLCNEWKLAKLPRFELILPFNTVSLLIKVCPPNTSFTSDIQKSEEDKFDVEKLILILILIL